MDKGYLLHKISPYVAIVGSELNLKCNYGWLSSLVGGLFWDI